MISRRTFVNGSVLSFLAVPLAVEAQQAGKLWRIGVLHGLPPDISLGLASLRQELRSLGYTD